MLVGQTTTRSPTTTAGRTTGLNPYLAVLVLVFGLGALTPATWTSPPILRAIATDGTYVYLGLLGSSQIERVTISSGAKSFYSTQIPPTSVFSAYGKIFAVGNNGFQVFDSSMNSLKVSSLGRTPSSTPTVIRSPSNSGSISHLCSCSIPRPMQPCCGTLSPVWAHCR